MSRCAKSLSSNASENSFLTVAIASTNRQATVHVKKKKNLTWLEVRLQRQRENMPNRIFRVYIQISNRDAEERGRYESGVPVEVDAE